MTKLCLSTDFSTVADDQGFAGQIPGQTLATSMWDTGHNIQIWEIPGKLEPLWSPLWRPYKSTAYLQSLCYHYGDSTCLSPFQSELLCWSTCGVTLMVTNRTCEHLKQKHSQSRLPILHPKVGKYFIRFRNFCKSHFSKFQEFHSRDYGFLLHFHAFQAIPEIRCD